MSEELLSISVITPSFQQGAFIQQTIDSVLTQLPSKSDYWVIDACSTDSTLNVLSSTKNDQFHYCSEPDKGQADAFNKGVKNTKHPIIGWLNSDDIYYPGTIKTVLKYFQEHPKVDIVYGLAWHIDEANKKLNPYPVIPWHDSIIKQRCFISQPAVFFRRHVFEMAGLLDISEQFCLDYEFWVRAKQAGCQFAFIPKVLAATRVHPATKTTNNADDCHLGSIEMIHQKYGYVSLGWALSYGLLKNKSEKQKPARYLKSIKATVQTLWKYNGFLLGSWRLIADLPILVYDKWLIHDNRKLYNRDHQSI